jgi:hypothetical protein
MRSLSTQQVADNVGVSYSTLLKWQSVDKLLQPTLGAGGRRGGDRWNASEALLAGVVASLRAVGLPVRLVKAIIAPLRAWRGRKTEVTVYVAVCVRSAPDEPEKRVAYLRLDRDGQLREATQLTLF